MKKLVSCLLVVMLLASLTVCAFAAASPAQGGGAGGAAPKAPEATVIPADSSELTEEQKEGAAAAAEALDGIDVKADVEGVADAAGEDEVTAGGMYYVKADKFPAPYTFSAEQAKNLLGVLFFGKDGKAAPTFTKADGAKVEFPAEGWYCNLYGAVAAP